MNLSKVIRSFGTLSLVNFARKHMEKLRQSSEAEITALADSIQTAVEQLDLAYTARRPLVALWTNATSTKDAADDALDTAIAGLSYDLLSPAYLNGDRKNAAYRALFPNGNINFIQGPDRAEVVQVNAIVTYLKANTTHPMADRASDLETKVATLDAALSPVIAAESALHSARAVEKENREELVRVLRKSAAVLRAELMDEKQVEALFPSVAEAQVQEDETTATTAAQ